MMKKLAIITSHPIQYHAPLFKLLAEREQIKIKVFYTWWQSQEGFNYDVGFSKNIKWDIPLLEGYEYMFVNNISKSPGSHHFNGIINPTLKKEILDWRANAILVFGWSFKSHLNCLRYFHKKIPVFFRGDSTLLNKPGGIKKIIRTIFLRWVYSHVDHALYVGTNNKAYYLKHGLQQSQLTFAPHAIDISRFSSPDTEYTLAAKNWRKEMGIKDNELVILFGGKLEDVKNPEIIIEAAKKFKNMPVKFVLVGNGHLEKYLKNKTHGNENIIFQDFVNQSLMPVVYRVGDIFILPSKSETWGLSINEAMASSRPILVSDKCGCAIDLVKENLNGFIFISNDIVDLINKINLIIHKKEELLNMGKESFKIIKNWSFDNIADKIEKVTTQISIT